MINRIHILGASGSGTTTLAYHLSQKLGCKHFDTDDFFWLETDPPYQQKRETGERIELLSKGLHSRDEWVLSGSLCGWGDIFIPEFDLVIFLLIPHEIRMKRLQERESRRYGSKIEINGSMYNSHLEFMEWASRYDNGGLEVRSRKEHYEWLNRLECMVIRIEEDLDVELKMQKVIDVLEEKIKKIYQDSFIK